MAFPPGDYIGPDDARETDEAQPSAAVRERAQRVVAHLGRVGERERREARARGLAVAERAREPAARVRIEPDLERARWARGWEGGGETRAG